MTPACGCPACSPPLLLPAPLPAAPGTAWDVWYGLLDHGFCYVAAADALGVSSRVGWEVHRCRLEGIKHPLSAWSQARAMAWGGALPTAGRVHGFGARRRLRALAAAGWTTKVMAGRTGLAPTTLRDIQVGRQRAVWATTHHTVDGLWLRVADRVGVSWQAAAMARGLGWPTWAAWQGVDIDDPAAVLAGFPRVDAAKKAKG